MRHGYGHVAAGVLLAVTIGAADPQPVAMPGWLSGGWSMQSESGAWSEEWWTPPKGGLMLGAGRSGKGDAIEWWEQTRIQLADGKLSFCALPKGQAGACFDAVAIERQSITFENAEHDYPQRIRYSRVGDELSAEISLKDGSKPNRWRFKRAN